MEVIQVGRGRKRYNLDYVRNKADDNREDVNLREERLRREKELKEQQRREKWIRSNVKIDKIAFLQL